MQPKQLWEHRYQGLKHQIDRLEQSFISVSFEHLYVFVLFVPFPVLEMFMSLSPIFYAVGSSSLSVRCACFCEICRSLFHWCYYFYSAWFCFRSRNFGVILYDRPKHFIWETVLIKIINYLRQISTSLFFGIHLRVRVWNLAQSILPTQIYPCPPSMFCTLARHILPSIFAKNQPMTWLPWKYSRWVDIPGINRLCLVSWLTKFVKARDAYVATGLTVGKLDSESFSPPPSYSAAAGGSDAVKKAQWLVDFSGLQCILLFFCDSILDFARWISIDGEQHTLRFTLSAHTRSHNPKLPEPCINVHIDSRHNVKDENRQEMFQREGF